MGTFGAHDPWTDEGRRLSCTDPVPKKPTTAKGTPAMPAHEIQPPTPATQSAAPTSMDRFYKRRRPRIVMVVFSILALLAGGLYSGYRWWYTDADRAAAIGMQGLLEALVDYSESDLAFTSVLDETELTINGTLSTWLQNDFVEFGFNATVNETSPELRNRTELHGMVLLGDGRIYARLDNLSQIIADTDSEENAAQRVRNARSFDGRPFYIDPFDSDLMDPLRAPEFECLSTDPRQLLLDEQVRQEVIDLATQTQPLVVTESLGLSRIEDRNSHGYRLEPDRQGLRDFILGLERTEFGRELGQCSEEVDFSSFLTELDTTLDRFEAEGEPLEMAVWVSRFRLNFTEFRMSASHDDLRFNIAIRPGEVPTDRQLESPTNAVRYEELVTEVNKIDPNQP